MYFTQDQNRLTARQRNETILVEPWGTNALRIRVTKNPRFTMNDNALSPVVSSADIEITESGAHFSNGKMSCFISVRGWMEFYMDGSLIIK